MNPTSMTQPQSIIAFNCLPNQVLGLLNAFMDLHNLWMTCRELWQSEAKREIAYLQLTEESSKKFNYEEVFRDLVESRVVYPCKQISC